MEIIEDMEDESKEFDLSKLGRFKVEKTEDYGNSMDHSYEEMIRVSKSKPEKPVYSVPSHLYKYSETKLCLYLKDHKNTWKSLGKLLNQDVDMSDAEVVFVFPVSKFAHVSKIVRFTRKRGSSIPSEAFITARKKNQFSSKDGDKVKQKQAKITMNTLDSIFDHRGE